MEFSVCTTRSVGGSLWYEASARGRIEPDLAMRAAVELGSSSTRLLVLDELGKVVTRMEERTAIARCLLSKESNTKQCACYSRQTNVLKRKGNVYLPTSMTSAVIDTDSIHFVATKDALTRFGAKLDVLDVQDVRAVATGAYRAAKNGMEVVQQASMHLGHEIRLISAFEEGTLAASSARSSTGLAEALVIDLGGWTCELVTTSGRVHSMPIGCIAMKSRVLSEGKGVKERCQDIVNDELQHIDFSNDHHDVLIALGGTATSLAALRLKLHAYHPESVQNVKMSRADIQNLAEQDTCADYWVQRKDTMRVGAYTLASIMTKLGVENAVVSDVDMLLGLVGPTSVS